MRINYKHLIIGGLALNFMLEMSPSHAAKRKTICPDGGRPYFNVCPGGEEPIPVEEYENKSRPPSDSGGKSRRNCSRMPNGKVSAGCDPPIVVSTDPQHEELERQKQDYRTAYDTNNYIKAIEILSELVKHDDAWSQNNLGDMYYYGKGTTQDYNEAIKWYRKAAAQGYAKGQNNLGFMYKNGYGVNQDDNEAVKWFSKAAEQGNALAQNNLGWMHQNGNGVTQDYNKAVKWYRKAAEQSFADGQNNLGVMYANGYGVTRDYNEAIKWYRKAAEQGNEIAKENLKQILNR